MLLAFVELSLASAMALTSSRRLTNGGQSPRKAQHFHDSPISDPITVRDVFLPGGAECVNAYKLVLRHDQLSIWFNLTESTCSFLSFNVQILSQCNSMAISAFFSHLCDSACIQHSPKYIKTYPNNIQSFLGCTTALDFSSINFTSSGCKVRKLTLLLSSW